MELLAGFDVLSQKPVPLPEALGKQVIRVDVGVLQISRCLRIAC